MLGAIVCKLFIQVFHFNHPTHFFLSHFIAEMTVSCARFKKQMGQNNEMGQKPVHNTLKTPPTVHS